MTSDQNDEPEEGSEQDHGGGQPQNRYIQDGQLQPQRAQRFLYDVTDGYLSSLEGVEYEHGSATSSGPIRRLIKQSDPDVDPDMVGSRLLKLLSMITTHVTVYGQGQISEKEAMYHASKFVPAVSKLSDRYAMGDPMYRAEWHDDVVAICEAIARRNQELHGEHREAMGDE